MISYGTYEGEAQLENLTRLISKDLSEPYSIFTYRYFLHTWPSLCITVSLMRIDRPVLTVFVHTLVGYR